MRSNIEIAKIGSHAMQQTLFPRSPREVCDEVTLNWLAALRLRDGGWLTFDPEATKTLDPAQEEELRFLGSLVAAGCDERMLKHLLRGLNKPYSYSIKKIYYAWYEQKWQLIPPDTVTREMVTEWVEEQTEERETEELLEIYKMIGEALARLDAKKEGDEEEQA